MERSHYEVLAVKYDASDEDLKRAYRQLAREHHPDRNPDRQETATAEFKRIGAAYETLRDPSARRAYDQRLRFGAKPSRSYTKDEKSGEEECFEDWDFARAEGLFREVFGEEVLAGIATVAAEGVAALSCAVDKILCNESVVGTASVGLASMAAQAERDTEQWQQQEHRCRTLRDQKRAAQRDIEEYQRTDRAKRNEKTRVQLRHLGWMSCAVVCGLMLSVEVWTLSAGIVGWGVVAIGAVVWHLQQNYRTMQLERQQLRKVQDEASCAERQWREAKESLRQAQQHAVAARQQVSDVQNNGVSFSDVAMIGMHFLGKLRKGPNERAIS